MPPASYPPPASSSPSSGNYDFIINPPKASRTSLLSVKSSPAGRLLVVVGALFVIVIVTSLLFKVFGSSSTSLTTSLVSLTQSQNELIRVSSIGSQQVVSQNAKNLAIDVQLSLTSSQQQLISYLKHYSSAPSSKQLGLTQDKNTDQQLTAAQAAGTYDATFVSIILNGLNSYSATLARTYSAAKSQNLRQLLSNQYNSAQLLIIQAKQANS
ncbi:MAG TPA: hypothetical protein VNE40_04780 [Candidatus Dormibacteraeota bacterium]|nr:hypothetical protein [Candidatus Dormibacteraeota bacterium]